MSAFGKVSLTDNDMTAVESVVTDSNTVSTVEEQVEKFDTSYNVEKLQELYAEYDKITIDEEKVKSLTQIKTNAIANNISFRMVLGVTTTAIVTILLAFLCIYNIFVINGMSGSIDYLQEEVVACQETLVRVEGVYNDLTDMSGLDGYTDMTSSIEAVNVPEGQVVIELQGETNWFDSVCNFLSRVFG